MAGEAGHALQAVPVDLRDDALVLLAVDLIYAAVDPRIKSAYIGKKKKRKVTA